MLTSAATNILSILLFSISALVITPLRLESQTFCLLGAKDEQTRRRTSIETPLSSSPRKTQATFEMESDSGESNPYASPSFIGHSLWLIPDEASCQKFEQAIQLGVNQFNGVDFGPHCTLIAGVPGSSEQVLQTTEELAAAWARDRAGAGAAAAVGAAVAGLECRPLYFQSVYARLRPPAGGGEEGLTELRAAARSAFGQGGGAGDQEDDDYMPHISLFYGDRNMEEKDQIRSSILSAVVGVETIDVIFRKIEVWSTLGKAHEWFRVGTVELNQNDNGNNR